MGNVRVTLNLAETVQRLTQASSKAIAVVSEQALQDCNYYCKQDQGTLISSSQTHSDFEKGRLVWQTPYARKQYYLRSASDSQNVNAEWMWAHKAASVHKDDWRTMLDTYFKQFAQR